MIFSNTSPQEILFIAKMTTETEDLEEFAYLYDFYIKAEYSIDLLRLMRIKPIEKDECDAEYDRAIRRFICISPYVYDVEHPRNGCKLLVAKLKSLIKELENFSKRQLQNGIM